jgi:predicted transcriptional regulator
MSGCLPSEKFIDNMKIYCMSYGMSTMTYRTSFALDRETVHRLKRLASVWQVSQAEVVRRAVADAAETAQTARPDPVSMLQKLHASGGGLTAETAERYLAEVRRDRDSWRRS